MIASRDGEAVAVHRARNADNSALRYSMDPMEQYQLQNSIDEAGLDLGAIYHSHTRSDPVPLRDGHQPRQARRHGHTRLPRHPLPDRRRQGPRGRPAPLVDRRQRRRAGRAPGDGLIWALVCPSCGLAHGADERFCEDCGLPLVPPRPSGGVDERAIRARKVRPDYAEGPLVRAAWARNQSEAELVQGLLLEEGVPSLARRSGGFDVPDFLVSGPRDIMVPASGLEAAREILGEPRGGVQKLPANAIRRGSAPWR